MNDLPTRTIKALATGFDVSWTETYAENLAVSKTFLFLQKVFAESGNHNSAIKIKQVWEMLRESQYPDLEWVTGEAIAKIESQI